MDGSRRQSTKAAFISYIMRDNRWKVIMAKSKRLVDCVILVIECLAVRGAILMTIQKEYSENYCAERFIVGSNSINGSIGVPKFSGGC